MSFLVTHSFLQDTVELVGAIVFLGVVVLFISYKTEWGVVQEDTHNWDQGHRIANKLIDSGKDPQKLYDIADGSLDTNSWDNGWKQACLNRGAKDNI